MDTSIALIKELGLPVAIAVALGLFLWRGVWPFITKQVDFAQNQTREATQAFLALQKTLTEHTEVNRNISTTLSGLKDGQEEILGHLQEMRIRSGVSGIGK